MSEISDFLIGMVLQESFNAEDFHRLWSGPRGIKDFLDAHKAPKIRSQSAKRFNYLIDAIDEYEQVLAVQKASENIHPWADEIPSWGMDCPLSDFENFLLEVAFFRL